LTLELAPPTSGMRSAYLSRADTMTRGRKANARASLTLYAEIRDSKTCCAASG
jgi:hypothetical protein